MIPIQHPPDLPAFLSVDEVARMLRVTPQTVRNMIADGKLQALQTGAKRGIFRIPSSELGKLGLTDQTQASSEMRLEPKNH